MINTDSDLGEDERRRYARHFALPELGEAGQQRLKNARVLCIGAGGLGSPLLLYLAAAGVGTIGICDFDTVDESNLQRQVLFTAADIGKGKAVTAAKKLRALNPHIKIIIHIEKLSAENALALFESYDIIADGSDNFPTRYLANDAAVLTDKPLVFGAVSRFEGQVSVFNLSNAAGERSPHYRDLFPQPPAPGAVLNCAEAGVLGVLPGIIGSMMASEVIKIVSGIGETLAGKFFMFDAASFTSRTLKIRKNSDAKITELIDYEFFCGEKIPEISRAEFAKLQKSGASFRLIDVREKEEYERENMGGELLPLSAFPKILDDLPQGEKYVVHCQSGKRSREAVRMMREAGFAEVESLVGGLSGMK